MKKVYICIAFVFTMLFLPQIVSAKGLCDNRDLLEQRAKARNVNVSYSYTMENGEPIFSVTISNLYDDMYISLFSNFLLKSMFLIFSVKSEFVSLIVANCITEGSTSSALRQMIVN